MRIIIVFGISSNHSAYDTNISFFCIIIKRKRFFIMIFNKNLGRNALFFNNLNLLTMLALIIQKDLRVLNEVAGLQCPSLFLFSFYCLE